MEISKSHWTQYEFTIYCIVFSLLLNWAGCTQNQAPRFDPPLQANYFFPEYNLTKPGDTLLWLNATDSDNNDELSFGVEGGSFYRKLFRIDRVDESHARVTARQVFDRESQDKYENIVFYVQDRPGNRVYQSVRFVILDIDDNPPIFARTPYIVNVDENHAVDTVIFDSIQAYDLDGPLYNKFYFELQQTDQSIFSITKTQFISSGKYSTKLMLRGKLDYEKAKSHILTIHAIGENSHLRASTEIIVNVIDYPNRLPEFTQSPYYVRIDEELPVGTQVVRVVARDGDSGINNQCVYKFDEKSGDDQHQAAASYFRIDSQSGWISIAKRIDLESEEIIRQSGGLIEFWVVASEIGDEKSKQSVKVVVKINDINDNEPSFNKDSFQFDVSARSSIGTALILVDDQVDSIRATDPDKGLNGSFTLTLYRVSKQLDNSSIQYDDYSDFEVIPRVALNEASLIIKVKNSSNLLDRMGSVEHYQLFAKDNGVDGKMTHTDLYIKIEGVNQYAPRFDIDEAAYQFEIPENSVYNTTVGLVHATDSDSYDNFGEIRYELKNGQQRFDIDSKTGRVYTIATEPTQQLDRELIDTFFMSVDAYDGPGLRTSIQLVVKLTDINDNRPQFIFNNNQNSAGLKTSSMNSTDGKYLIGYIEENAAKWIECVRLQATDRDIDLNGQIEYQVESAEFYFKEYFEITNENSTYYLRLKMNRVLDFEEIYELKKKSLLLNQTRSTKRSMILNPGEIDLNIVVVAQDMGTPSLSSRLNVKVIVKDVNDNKPIFDKLLYSLNLPESFKYGEVYQVKAVDSDAPNTANSKIIYSIESGSQEKFLIDSHTGVVRLVDNSALDKDLHGSTYLLKIVASNFNSFTNSTGIDIDYDILHGLNTDSFTNMSSYQDIKTNYCFVRINIVDVNNKKPYFLRNNEVIHVIESVPINTMIYKFEAYDPDSNPLLSYYLVKSNSSVLSLNHSKILAFDEYNRVVDANLVQNWFEVHPKDGYLYTKSSIDREIAETITLVVGVEDLNADNDTRPQMSTTTLTIKIKDVNDNYPEFLHLRQLNKINSVIDCDEQPIYELYESVEENAKQYTRLAQLSAIDIDKNRNLTYKVIHSTDPSQNSLVVDKHSGVVFVNGLIDYETTKWINMTIVVCDNDPTPRPKSSLLHFYARVLDQNDNPPRFIEMNTTEFRVAENNEINAVIAQFKAVDPDSSSFGQIEYKLISGDAEKFEINAQNGILYVKEKLDREEQDLYTLMIQALDNPASTNQLTDSLMIRIRVLDENDNKPYCEQDQYVVETVQNVQPGTVLLQVKAIDLDAGQNAQIQYHLTLLNQSTDSNANELFIVDPSSGQIRTNQELVGYFGLYQFQLSLVDSLVRNEHEPSYTTGCLIDIHIKEFNMHAPQFVLPILNNSVHRIVNTLESGAYLLTVKAVDNDPGTNGQVYYYLDQTNMKNNDWKSFSVDSNTGVLTLNVDLDANKQTVYSIVVIASDLGKPSQLSTRAHLTFILVDEANNSAMFDKAEICILSSESKYECQRSSHGDFGTLLVRLDEELPVEKSSVFLGLAKLNDHTKSDQSVCYYLNEFGDKKHFRINKKTGVLSPRNKLDREYKDRYELVIKASEHCYCTIDDDDSESGTTPRSNGFAKALTSEERENCEMMKLATSIGYDPTDITQLRVVILVNDINDNEPRFDKNLFHIGLMSELQKGEIVLESFASDTDLTGSLRIALVESSFSTNLDLNALNILSPQKSRIVGSSLVKKQPTSLFPFLIEQIPITSLQNQSTSHHLKFRIMSTVYLKESILSRLSLTQTPYLQFKLNVYDDSDESRSHKQTTTVRLVYINRDQRVKLVFAKPIDQVLLFQDEFQAHVSNLTGVEAVIDKVSIYHSNQDQNGSNSMEGSESNSTSNKVYSLTEMVLHFVKGQAEELEKLACQNDLIVDADKILSKLDKLGSRDSQLVKNYKLVLAEKYDEHSVYKFYKYGSDKSPIQSSVDESSTVNSDFSLFNSLLLWQSNSKQFLTRVLLALVCIILLILSLLILLVCCCMRTSYKRKLRAERALVKAFGLEQRSLTTYNDTINGYVNAAFDSNSLLPIPGTNLYAYEGSNPVWLKKYDKLDNTNNPSSSTSSASSTTSTTQKQQTEVKEEISSFYLKQIDSSPPTTSKCSPGSYSEDSNEEYHKNSGATLNNKTMTSEVFSIQEAVNQSQSESEVKESKNNRVSLTSFRQQIDPPLLTFVKSDSIAAKASLVEPVVSFKAQLKHISEKYLERPPPTQSSHKAVFNHEPDNKMTTKEFYDLFEVESTVI